MTSKHKKITCSIVIPLLILMCYSVCYSQQVSKIVNYNAEYTPFSDGIQKEYAFPNNVDPDNHFQIVFTFDLTPEQIEADVTGTMTFDQENGTIQLRGKDGNLQSKGGLTLKGVVKIAFVIESVPYLTLEPTLLVAVFAINQLVDFPLLVKDEVTVFEPGGLDLSQLLSELIPIGSLTVNPYQTWDESEPFSTLLLDDDVVVRGGIRKLVQAELTAVEVTQLIVTALTAIPPSLSKPAATIVEKGIGNAAISANLGFLSTATLSGESITVNGVKITRENQTIKAPGLDMSQNSYTVNSSYNEKFTYKLDLAATSDVTLEFNPLGIPIWNYEKVIGELPITPIVSEQEVDLNFTSNQTTFPIAQTSTVQAPVPQGAIPFQSLSDDGSGTTVNVAQYFSSSNSLKYEVSTNPSNIATASVSGSRVTIRPVEAGTATVIVLARDTVTNLTATQTIYVVVRQTSTVHPPNNDQIFSVPNGSNPRAEGLREGVSVIIQNVPLTGDGLNLRSNPWIGNNVIRELWNGGTGIITDGPEENNGYTWWKIEWDQVDIEAWSVEAFGGDQLLFRRPPDLEIRDFDLNESQVGIGEEIELEVDIRNNGPGESAATDIYFYYHSGSRNDDLEELSEERDLRSAGKLSVPSLRQRESTTLTLRVNALNIPDRYYYGAFLPSNVHDTDYQDDLTVSMLTNNLAGEEQVQVTGYPDYIVESISVSKTTLDPGESFTLRATVRNQGLGEPTSSADLDYYRSSDARISPSDRRVGDDSVTRLDADETGRESISLTAPTEPGVYYYGACVSDVDNESNSNNNCSAAVAITVQAPDPDEPALPNLVVETPTTSAATLGPGESFTLNATVRNNGTANSSATTFRWYRSPNSNISMNDTEIGSANVSSLNVGGRVTQQINLTAPMESGTYYYGGCVESITDESDTGDNCSYAITITVQNRAPTTVGTISSQTLSVTDTHIRLDVSTYFSDPNNTSLTYTAISSDTSIVVAEAAGVSGSILTIRPIAEGSATITITASDGELTATQTFSVTVNPIPVTISESPDLVITLSSNKSLVDSNASINLEATVRNQGTADASNSTTVRYYLSADAAISPDDQQIGTDSVRRIRKGNSDEEIHSVRAPNQSGIYYYYACVDSVTDEEHTDNNCSNIIIINVRGSDLIIDTVNVAPRAQGTIAAQTLNVGTPTSLDVSGYFTDANNDTLIFTLNSSNTSVATAQASESTVTITPVSEGNATITVEADDGELTATQTITVTVNTAAVSEETWMPDVNLRATVRTALGLQEHNALTQETLQGLTSLSAPRSQISDLTGLEHATNLRSLNLDLNQISDITPVEGLTSLTTLGLGNNSISDISVVSGLTSLTTLSLVHNSISDVSPIENLTALTELYLSGNPITDLAPLRRLQAKTTQTISIDIDITQDPNNDTSTDDLSEEEWMPDANLRVKVRTALGLQEGDALTQETLQGLTRLSAIGSEITDITGLEYATQLQSLDLSENQISDISAVSGLTSLTSLSLVGNSISDISAVSGLTSLTFLDLLFNSISDISAVSGLTSLTTLGLGHNSISDLSAVSGLTSLTWLSLAGNSISDISAVSGLTSLTTLGL